jgi:osmoprotectant transport system substrate-binding protein
MRRALYTLIVLLMTAVPVLACVGKSLVVGTDSTPESRAAAQILSIIINERTGTTVEIVDFPTADALLKQMTAGDVEGAVDLALCYTARSLKAAGKPVPADSNAALEAVKAYYMEELNLVWLTPFGFSEPGNAASLGVPVAQKHALKKFPALPRLIAKTGGVLTEAVMRDLMAASNTALAARDFLRRSKLI